MNTAKDQGASRRQAGSGRIPLGECHGRTKIQARHWERLAVVYVRQSTPRQVQENVESTALQYQLARRAEDLGWRPDRVLVIDDDLGQSAQTATHRLGFQRLLAEVGLNHVGLVLGVEMSRLARSYTDWYQLLELCAVFGCLLADQDGVYDPNDYNDRLLLGLKGTMSEAELHVLRARMDQGRRNKAERGELFSRLPAGYVFLDSGAVALDPDQQVQAVVRLVFDKFSELGSARAVTRYLRQRQIALPLRPLNGPRCPPLEWRAATPEAVYAMLTHPMYAGAYVHGRRPVDAQRKLSGTSRRAQVAVPMEEWQVLLRDHLPAYISWDQYLANRERLRQNASSWETQGAPRQGAALLGGLLYCGRCGYRMQVHYVDQRHGYYRCSHSPRCEDLGPCPSLPVPGLDALVSRQVLRALEPAALEVSLQASEDLERERQRLHQHWQQQVERARHQAERARRQYEAVEPENRLVARHLEGQWEKALVHLRQQEEAYARFQQELPAALSRVDREAIRALAHDLPQVWDAPSTAPADRQVVIRHLIDRVRAQVQGTSEDVAVTISWKGGFVSQHQLLRSLGSYRQLGDYDRLIQRLNDLRNAGERALGIATQLNAEGFRPPRGEIFTGASVRTLLSRQGLSRLRTALECPEGCGPEDWWAGDLARELGVSVNGVKGWIRRGWVHGRRVRGRCGYWVVWADAEELERLRRLRDQRQTPYPPELTTPKARPTGTTKEGKRGLKERRKKAR